MPDQPSQAVQDYLKTIHSLEGSERRVRLIDIAARLQVRAPSVTGMLKRLADAGWIDYEPGSGARLTSEGISEARRVIRRHRLVELFLTRVLGLDWSEVDAEAEALEHAISPRLEQAIAAHLGEPVEDPHGHPIPTREGVIARRELRLTGPVPRRSARRDPRSTRRQSRTSPALANAGAEAGSDCRVRQLSTARRRVSDPRRQSDGAGRQRGVEGTPRRSGRRMSRGRSVRLQAKISRIARP